MQMIWMRNTNVINPLKGHHQSQVKLLKIKLFMKVVKKVIYVAMASFCLNLTVSSQNITLKMSNITVKQAMDELKSRSGYSFVFSSADVDTGKKISVSSENQSINAVIEQILRGQGLTYEIQGKNIILKKDILTSVDKKTKITGIVKDQYGEPIIGANVVVKGTTLGTITDIDGNYTLDIPLGASLQVSYIGYLTQEVATVGKNNINVSLIEDTQKLEEVVVVAYGVQKKATKTGAIEDIKGEDLKKNIAPNVSGSLAGKLSGVSMRPSNGKPGEDNPKIYIRGISSTGKQEPLIVVDGVIRDNMNQIDPNDIESISVLKDAAAIAPYGLGGANGVVLITTKKGETGKPTLSLNAYYGWQSPTVYPDMVNAKDYMTLRNEAYLNDNNGQIPQGGSLPFSPDLIADYDRLHALDPDKYPNSNFYDEMANFNTPIQSYNLSLSGGSEKVRYYLGLGYFDQQGMFDPVYYKRYSMNAKVDMDATKTTKLAFAMNGTVERNNLGPAPFAPGYMPIKNLYFSNGLPGESNGSSPGVELNSGSYDRRDNNTLLTTISIEQQLPFIKGLSVKGVFSYDPDFRYEKTWTKPNYYYIMDETTSPYTYKKAVNGEEITSLNQKSIKNERLTYQAYANYAQTFGKHEVTGLLVFEARDTKSNWFSAYRKNFQVDMDEMDMGNSDKMDFNNGGSSSQTTQAGIVYRATYGYDGKYLVEASGRYDGHSYFAPGKRWAFFPSFSAGWRISEEKFFKENISWVDNLKIRASWGQSGNLAGDPFQYLSAYELFNNAYAFGNTLVQGSKMPREANPNITWEKAESMNIGIDASFFNGLLTFAGDYFYQRREGMLLSPNINVPVEYGLGLAEENAGVMNNRGFEFQIGVNKMLPNGLMLHFDGNFSYAKNEMEKIYESLDTYNSPNRRRTGRSWKTPFGYKALGLFSTADDKNSDGVINVDDGYMIDQFGAVLHPGDVKYADISGPEGTPDGVIDAWDETVVGYAPYPRITYGFTLTAEWKGFDVSLFFQGAAQASINTQGYVTVPFRLNNTNVSYEFFNNYWTPERQDARYPRITQSPYKNNTTNSEYDNGFGPYSSSFWMRNSNFLRLKNIVIGYTLPSAWTKKAGLNSVRIYWTGQNLLTFSNLGFIDPEIDYEKRDEGYPLQKANTIGLNVTF